MICFVIFKDIIVRNIRVKVHPVGYSLVIFISWDEVRGLLRLTIFICPVLTLI